MGCPEPELLALLASAGGTPETRAELADHVATCTGCHAALMAAMDLSNITRESVGMPTVGGDDRTGRVDRYIIERRLGAGGMGVVYEATDSELGRRIALKMLRRGAPAARLRREAQALARLDHRNVVAVHDVGEHEGQVFVAMALVDGSNLRDWLATERTVDAIVEVLREAGRGIVAAHAAGLVHRDLKPDNIFVARTGDVLVGDFGLARDNGDDDPAPTTDAAIQPLTMTGAIVGTPAYMAPEQLDGIATERSDQFAFCVTAYEALHGVRPFSGGTLTELMANVRASIVVEPVHARAVPARIERAVRRGLAADPAARFPSMAALLAEFAPRSRAWLRWIAPAAVAVALAAIAIALIASSGPSASATCKAEGARIGLTWNANQHDLVQHALEARGATPVAAQELADRLDGYAARWAAIREESCLAGADHKLAPEQLAVRESCLAVRRDDLARLASRVATEPGETALSLWHRLDALVPVEVCRDEATARLDAGDDAHRQLMIDFANLELAARDVKTLTPLLHRAIAAKDLPAQFEISLAIGVFLLGENDADGATLSLRAALATAEQLGVASLRARAVALLAAAACRQDRFDESRSLLTLAEAEARRDTSGALDLDVVLRQRAFCVARERPADGVPLLQQLLDRCIARHGPGSYDEVELRDYLATAFAALDRGDDAQRELQAADRIFARYERALTGGDAYDAKATAAFARGDLDAAIAAIRRAFDEYERVHQADAAVTALAFLAEWTEYTGRWRTAATVHDGVVGRIPRDGPGALVKYRVESLAQGGQMHLLLGEYDAAATRFAQALDEARARKLEKYVAEATLGIAQVAAERGDTERALRLLPPAIAALSARSDASPFRIGLAQFALARTRWAAGDHAGANAVATEAEANIAKGVAQVKSASIGKRVVPFREQQLAAVTAWRDAHRSPAK